MEAMYLLWTTAALTPTCLLRFELSSMPMGA